MKIFVTGGAGCIGTHTCIELLNAGYEVVVYDNFSNTLKRVEQITNRSLTFFEGNIRDEAKLSTCMHGCDAVIHFADLKAVGESVAKPLEYYDQNVNSTLCLLRAMQTNGIKTIVFSSSATVYGDHEFLPITKDGDIASCYAEPKKAKEILKWEAKRTIEEMCNDTWNFQSKNPKGYQ